MIAEILLVDPSIKATGEGGIFDQEELNNQSGRNIDLIFDKLNSMLPLAAQLLEAAIRSSKFQDCPSPGEWLTLFNTVPGFGIKPPSLSDIPDFSIANLKTILQKRKAKVAEPMWPVPKLDDMVTTQIKLPRENPIISVNISLPSDPWKN